MSYLVAVLALIAYYMGAFLFVTYWRPRSVRVMLSFLLGICSAVLVFLATKGNPLTMMVLFIFYSFPLMLVVIILGRRERMRASSKQ